MENIKKNKKIIIIAGVIVLIAIVIAISSNKRADNLTADEILTAMKQNEELKEMIDSDIEITNINDDSLGMLGKDNRYISKVKFMDSSDKSTKGNDEYYSGAIEVFNNVEDLKIRKQYLTYNDEKLNEKYSSEEYGKLLTLFDNNFKENYVYKNGNALLIISRNIDEKTAKKYKTAFDAVLKDKTYEQKDVPSKKQITKLTNEDKDNIDKYFDELSIQLDEKVAQLYQSIDAALEEIAQKQSETDLKEMKGIVACFDTAPRYQEKYNQWQTKIQEIEQQIAATKAAKEAEEAAKKAAEEAERQRKETLENNRHSAGMYKVGTDIPAGEYVLVGSGYFSIDKDSSGQLSSIIANDNFSGNSIISVSDGQYLTVRNAVFYNINLNPDVSTSGEGMFKVGLHIPAGEYKLVATRSLGYCEVSNSSKHTIGSIVSNDNFSGEKYITVRNGQYLKLSGCKINQ